MPPLTQIGPLTFLFVSSINPSDGSNFGSMALPVFLSHTTNRPDGQYAASNSVSRRASGSSDCLTRFQILPFGSQKRAKAQRLSASVRFRVGPAMVFACFR